LSLKVIEPSEALKAFSGLKHSIYSRIPPRIGEGATFFFKVLEAVREKRRFEEDFFNFLRIATVHP